MARLYDFGADASNVSANERRAVAWPVAVWSCYIPESECQGLNILEHLIMQLVQKGFTDPKGILCGQVGFHKDLVEAAIEACIDKDYFDRRYKELTLSTDGRKILGKIDDPYRADLEASKKNKKIFMIQDLVTKSVVPVFDIDSLPELYTEDDSAIEIRYEEFHGKKPKSASIKTALRYWARLCNNRRHGIISGSSTFVITQPPGQVEAVDGFIPFEDEVDREDIREDGTVEEDIQEDGTVEEDIGSLEDEEERALLEKADREVANITILDDHPEIYHAKGFLAIDRNSPDEAIVISPFGSRMDNWFRTVIDRLRACNESFEEDIQLFLLEKREELKDVIAFYNEMDIELFDKFPFICNDKEFADLKRAIEALVRTKDRIVAGEDETHNFTENRATALQIALRHLIDSHKELLRPKLSLAEYELAIKGLVDSYGLPETIIRDHLTKDNSVYQHTRRCKIGSGHITGYSALLLIDAWDHKNGKSMDLLKAMPEFPEIIYGITRPRNTSTHGNKGKNGKKGYAEMYVSKEEAVKGYKDFENVLTALYTRFMEGV